MIPKITECMFPLLQYMSDKKNHSAEECRDYISRVFNLSNDEKVILKSKDIVGWTKHRLRIIGMLETVSRGNYRITEDGLKFLQTTPPTAEKPFKKYGY
ncbi:MAG: winged helix-turn-helix domain-containing protein [Bacteroidaceae bacterium]|nr:winged helix-turn-helix domain-containing protein [Bacteroidaceae bacterium]